MPYMISTGNNYETLKQVRNPIYEAKSSGPADFLPEAAEQQANQDDDLLMEP